MSVINAAIAIHYERRAGAHVGFTERLNLTELTSSGPFLTQTGQKVLISHKTAFIMIPVYKIGDRPPRPPPLFSVTTRADGIHKPQNCLHDLNSLATKRPDDVSNSHTLTPRLHLSRKTKRPESVFISYTLPP